MPTLASNPSLDQLRHQARDLLNAARAREPEALDWFELVSVPATLSGAQLALAREYGFASWAELKLEVEMRNRTLAEAVEEFLRFSVNRVARAGAILGQHPDVAGYDVRTALMLGDAARVQQELESDCHFVTRRDPGTHWTPLHGACASRWHVDPARIDGLVATVRMLLDAGAELNRAPDHECQWSPLRCAIASAGSGRGNEPILELLLERGARVEDHDLYLAEFTSGEHEWCQRLLLAHTPDVRAIAEQALSAPVSMNHVEAVRLLLDAGADPGHYRDGDGQPVSAVKDAIAHGCDPELLELLIGHGAADDTTPLERLAYLSTRGDRAAAERLLADTAVRAMLPGADGSALIGAAERGDTGLVARLLEAGLPIDAHGGRDGATALHAAAYAGSAVVVTQLLAGGAPLEARDATWQDTPLGWALVGSGHRPDTDPYPNWLATVQALLDAGADTSELTLSPDAEKPPSDEVAAFLRAAGVAQ